MDNQQRIAAMTDCITASLQPSSLEIIDDSASHAGHAGAKTGKGHFILKIKSDAFEDKSILEQHRMIYAALGDLMTTDIHALTIQVL